MKAQFFYVKHSLTKLSLFDRINVSVQQEVFDKGIIYFFLEIEIGRILLQGSH